MADLEKVKAGDRVGIYKVLDPGGFGGTLPTAEIVGGEENVGVKVILTSPFRLGAV